MLTLGELLALGFVIINAGTNSIILEKDGHAFKISREFKNTDIARLISSNNKLCDSGILTPRIYGQTEVVFGSEEEYSKTLTYLLDKFYTTNNGIVNFNDFNLNSSHDASLKYVLPMIEYDLVKGEQIFNKDRTKFISIVNKNPQFYKQVKSLKEKSEKMNSAINSELNQNFTVLSAVSQHEIEKFVLDAAAIINSGYSIDNATGNNFEYGEVNKQRGFVFLDLNLSNQYSGTMMAETNPLVPTIDNICKLIYVDTDGLDPEIKAKQKNVLEGLDLVITSIIPKFSSCENYLKNITYYTKLTENLKGKTPQKQPSEE
ncbi:MAG: hypothetical protein IJ538_02630 [Clostridia bacterium]|nr:hypothetical protein [Clostridia bacterium]